MSKTDDAYAEGRDDYDAGLELDDNPYMGTQFERAWFAGWYAARDEDDGK